MFTGIIEGLGTIAGIKPMGTGKRLVIDADFLLDMTGVGDSIAVSGACLTVTFIKDNRFEVDVSPETISKTTLGGARTGNRVNLERALRLSDRLDGHLVTGHVDGMGTIKNIQNEGNAIIVTLKVPSSLGRYIINKGSVAIDGISLTINDCDQFSIRVAVIPHTAKLTTIGFKKIGDPVNIETDIIGKYVEKFINKSESGNLKKKGNTSGVDMQLLAKTGFLKH